MLILKGHGMQIDSWWRVHKLQWVNTLRPNYTTVNSLWPSDTMWQQRSGSTLAQVMACCLTAPSHYLNQSWQTIIKVLCHSPDVNSTFLILSTTSINSDINFFLRKCTWICCSGLNVLTKTSGLSTSAWGSIDMSAQCTIIGLKNGLSPTRCPASA